MREIAEPIAIAIADLHLQLKPPSCRDGEPCWMKAMARPLLEVCTLAESLRVPVICAGDVFDKWNPSPELINWALKNVPPMYAVPGQHDLPHHRYDAIHKSAYWTLVESGIITNITPTLIDVVRSNGCDLFLEGFPWGYEPKYSADPWVKVDGRIRIAVLHRYTWKERTIRQIDTPGHHISHFAKQLKGFDFAIFGDNHAGFIQHSEGGPTIVNCGSLMRRTSDQMEYEPTITILYSDGTAKPQKIDTKGEFFRALKKQESEAKVYDMEELMESIDKLRGVSFDFRATMKRCITTEEIDPNVAKEILEAMGE